MSFFKSIKGLFSNTEKIEEEEEKNYPRFDKTADKWAEYFYPSTYNPLTMQGTFRNLKGIKDKRSLSIVETFLVVSNKAIIKISTRSHSKFEEVKLE